MTEATVRAKLLRAIKTEGMRAFAHRAAVSEAFVYRAKRGEPLGPKILDALDVEAVVAYRIRRTNGGSRKP